MLFSGKLLAISSTFCVTRSSANIFGDSGKYISSEVLSG
jgi:hypothetical protein